MATRGKPPNKGENKAFEVTIPLDHYEYLTLLAKMNRLGVTETQVASHILIRELDAMFRADYHSKTFPKTKE